MNRIDAAFARLKREGRKALIGYVTAGYPRKLDFKTLVPLLERSGLDLLELGVPFSDPIADGPTIQASSQAALSSGANLRWVLSAVGSLRAKVRIPLLLMSYCNPIYAMGVERFFASARASGVDGLIVPDLIPEESGLFRRAAFRAGVHLIFLSSPTTPAARARRIARRSRGFLYVVSLTGVTGARMRLRPGLCRFLRQIKRSSARPLAVGFGLSTPQQMRALAPHVDGVIVGSALIQEIEKSRNRGFAGAARYVASLQKALNPVKEPLHAS